MINAECSLQGKRYSFFLYDPDIPYEPTLAIRTKLAMRDYSEKLLATQVIVSGVVAAIGITTGHIPLIVSSSAFFLGNIAFFNKCYNYKKNDVDNHELLRFAEEIKMMDSITKVAKRIRKYESIKMKGLYDEKKMERYERKQRAELLNIFYYCYEEYNQSLSVIDGINKSQQICDEKFASGVLSSEYHNILCNCIEDNRASVYRVRRYAMSIICENFRIFEKTSSIIHSKLLQVLSDYLEEEQFNQYVINQHPNVSEYEEKQRVVAFERRRIALIKESNEVFEDTTQDLPYAGLTNYKINRVINDYNHSKI